MKDTHEILTHNNINYWIIGGTLLGAVRHKGVIPFDDDLDIGVDRKDEIKLQKLSVPLENYITKYYIRRYIVYVVQHA